jgi:hypothetical protein
VKGIFDGITTAQLDEYTANYASTLAAEHPDFATLAGRIAVSNLQKQTSKVFSEAMEELYRNVDPITKESKPLIADDVYEIVMKNKEVGTSFWWILIVGEIRYTNLGLPAFYFYYLAFQLRHHSQSRLWLLLLRLPHLGTRLLAPCEWQNR